MAPTIRSQVGGGRPVTRSQTNSLPEPRQRYSPSPQPQPKARPSKNRRRPRKEKKPAKKAAPTPRSRQEAANKVQKASPVRLPNGLKLTPPKSLEWSESGHEKRETAWLNAVEDGEEDRVDKIMDEVLAEAFRRGDVKKEEFTNITRIHLMLEIAYHLQGYKDAENDADLREAWIYKRRCSVATCVVREKTPPVYYTPAPILIEDSNFLRRRA